MATPRTSAGGGYRHWRRTRPYWGGKLLVLSGVELFLSANLTLGDMQVHFGPEGFLSYLLPLLLVLCGLLTWFTPGQRIFYGILGLLTAVYSLIGLNLGGFFIGMFLGILGGALVLAWTPQRPQPDVAIPADVDEAVDPADPDDGERTEPQAPYAGQSPHDGSPDPDETAVLRPANHNGHNGHGQSGIVPGFQEGDGGPAQPPQPFGGIHRKALAITLVPLMVGAIVVAGGRSPARADDECPEGMPSRPAAAAKKEAARQSSASASASKTKAKATTKSTSSQAARRSAAPSSTAGKSSPAKADEAEEGDGGSGNVIVDGWNGLVDGVGDLLDIRDDEAAKDEAEQRKETAEEAAEPSTSTEPSAPPSAPVDPSGPAVPPIDKPAPETTDSKDPSGSPSGSASATASPTPSLPDIPCLGPRVFKVAGPDDVPAVSLRGGVLEGKSLTMYNSTYDGVIDLATAEGSVKALKFSMKKSVTKPFQLTVPEQTGAATVINSDKLTTEGNVKFYTPKFQGKLFGLIPVTFTPDQPPPLTLPILWFTDVKIQVAFVRCDTLTADPLKLTEKS
ncbi:DUF6114 domain-containing protein [Actinoplanes sp. NPDC051346]|uniref:DUF6114 domain-containing protein n=1 Tax=Actinoplanes sp. NPDC051346 TaxID=3155048 RepID=UPI003422686E